MIFLLVKIFVNGPFLNRLHALFASSQRLYNTWHLAISHILTRVDTFGAITLFFFSPADSPYLHNAQFTLIYELIVIVKLPNTAHW